MMAFNACFAAARQFYLSYNYKRSIHGIFFLFLVLCVVVVVVNTRLYSIFC
jgi:hypothetical protein